MYGRKYTPCPGDPLETGTIDDQVNRVLQIIEDPATFTVDKCDPGTNPGQGEAPVHDVGATGSEEIFFIGTQWGNLSVKNPYPWSTIAPTLWHEAAHNHGYNHCGGDGGFFDHGDVAYTITDCMEAVIRKSFDACGFPEKGCGSPTALHVIESFTTSACACVEDPSPTVPRNTDVDNDSIPDARDNCPFAFNPNQENCNSLAESVRGADVLGDACDPVPCPATYATHEVPGAPIPPAADPDCTPNPVPPGAPANQVTYACTKTAFNDHLVSDPVGSNRIDSNVTRGQVQIPTIVFANTSQRFCQNGPQFGIDCSSRAYVADALVNAPASADLERDNSPSAPWHRITTGITFPTSGRDVQFPWFYGDTHIEYTWFHAADVQYWITGPNAPKVPFPIGDPTCANGDCLDGNIWLHGDTTVGADVHAAGLVNTYFPLQPQEPFVYCPTGRTYVIAPPAPPGGMSPIRSGPSVAVTQASSLSLSNFLLWQPGAQESRAFDLRSVPDTELIAYTSFGAVAAIQDNGSAVSTEPIGSANCGGSSVGTGLHAQLASGVPWLNAVEPTRNIGVVASSLLAVAISRDGTDVVDSAQVQGTRLLASEDFHNCDLCGVGDDPPAPRSQFTAFFSRAAGGVFLLGGKDAATGATLHDVWFYGLPHAFDQNTPGWASIPVSGVALGDIRAATYSFFDKRLWVVDRIAKSEQRIVAVDPATGRSRVLFAWHGHDFEDPIYLSVDREGQVLLTHADENTFTVAQLEIDEHDALRATGFFAERGRLLLPPIVSEQSYAFVVKSHDAPLEIHRHASIFPKSECDHRRPWESKHDDHACHERDRDDGLEGLARMF